MIDLLKEIEKNQIVDLLTNGSWKSLNVDYHPPFVERVWIQLGENRLSLHVIHPCEEGESLWHPHPWKTSFRVFSKGGIYEQGIGSSFIDPLLSSTHVFTPLMKMEVPGDMYYEMTHSDCAHYVRPIDEQVYTIMLSGPAEWTENSIKADKELKPLSDARVEEILEIFKSFYVES